MWRFAGRLGVVLGVLAVSTAVVTSPAAAAEGVTVRISDIDGRLEAGAAPADMTAVASKSGRECIKVRWSLVVRVEDMSLDQITIDRREDSGSFPVDFQADGAEGRLTDKRLDPGRLCRGNNVTAHYTIALADDAGGGRLTLRTEAYNAENELLERDTTTRNILGDAPPSPSPTPTPTPEETAPPTEEPAASTAGGVAGPSTPVSNTGGSGLLPVGLAVGGMMVFLGLTLLLRARRRLLRAAPPMRRPGTRGMWHGAARTIRERR